MHGALTLLLGVRKGLTTTVGVVSALLLLVSMEVAAGQRPCGTASQKCAWPQFHHDTTNAGFTSSRGPRVGEVVWSAEVEGHVEVSPIVVGDKVFVGTLSGRIYALNESDGSAIWTFAVPGGDPLVRSACIYRAGKLFCATFSDGHVYALDAATGEQLWRSDGIAKAWMGNPALSGDLLFVPDTRGAMAAFDTLSGAEVWRFELPVDPYILMATGRTRRYKTYSSPAVDSGLNRIFFGSYYAAVHCLDLRNGTTIWENQLGDPFFYAPRWGIYYDGSGICDGPAVVGGRVYIGSLDGKLYALDEATGEELWSTYLGGAIRFSSPAVGHGRVYVATYKTYPDCGLHCLDAQTGERLWFQNIACTDSSPAVADGLAYIGAGKYVHAFDAYTGANTWSCQLMEARADGPDVYATFTSSPAVVNGYVYIGAATDEGGKVYKVR